MTSVKKEICIDPLRNHSITVLNPDLHKLDEWQTLVEPDNMEWFETDSEEDDEDDEDEENEDDEGEMDAD